MAMNLGSLGSLFIDMAANTAQFETDIGRASRESAKRSAEIQKGFQDAAKNIAASLAALDIGYKIGASLRDAINRADQLDEMAQKIGASTRGLSALQFAADLEGVDGLTASLGKLSKAMVESEKEGSEQGRAFAALGINVRDASGELKTSDVVLREIAQAFSESEDGATKSAVAMALLGRSGADMIPFLNNGAEGLDRLAGKAERLGLIIDEQTAKAAGEFNDNLFLIGKTADGLASRVAAQLLPQLSGLTDVFANVATNTDIAKTFADGLAVGFKGVALVVANVSYVFSQIGNEIGGIAAQAVALAHLDFGGVVAIRAAMVDDAEAARKKIDELNDSILNLGKTSREATDSGVIDMNAEFEKLGKKKINFSAADKFDGTLDPKAGAADAMRPLEEQIATESRLLQESLEQQQEYHQASYQAAADAAERQRSVADAVAESQRKQIDNLVMQSDAIASTFGVAADAASAFGAKGFAVFKALKIAEALIAIPSTAIKAYESALAVPAIGFALAPAAAAAAVAYQLAQVQQIRSMQFAGRRYGGLVGAGGMYEVAEPGNPELLRYGNKTLLMMGAQSGVVEPASRVPVSGLKAGVGSGLRLVIHDAPPGYRPVVNGDVATIDMLQPWAEHSARMANAMGAAQMASRSGPLWEGTNAGSLMQRRYTQGKVRG